VGRDYFAAHLFEESSPPTMPKLARRLQAITRALASSLISVLPLGTRIQLDHPVFGRRIYRVEDHIGWGSQLDIFNPSEAACLQYGLHEIGFRVLEY
jgi:hypothetical protein